MTVASNATKNALRRTYGSWANARCRCRDPKHRQYADYGGRGIRFDHRWNDFWQFVVDMGSLRPIDRVLDRIDNDGNYEPGNCRWTTCSENNKNRRKPRALAYFRGNKELKYERFLEALRAKKLLDQFFNPG